LPPTPVCQFDYIDSNASLEALIASLRGADRVAIDTEADSLHHYFEKVCLLQLTFLDRTYIVDPLADIQLEPLLKTLAEKKLVFHGAEYDLRMLMADYRFRPQGEVFDTMLAAQLVVGESRSLVALAGEYLGVELTKQGQRSDWSRRPLSESQLTYACNDTRYLEAIADKLKSELSRLGRLEWHRESCRRMVKTTGQEKPAVDPERVWRIKGLSELDRRQLAFVREIWLWRENEAQQADLPPFKVAGNQLIIELAQWASIRSDKSGPGEKRNPPIGWATGPKLPRNCVGERLSKLKDAIQKARAMREPNWPPLRIGNNYTPVEYPPELELLRAECDRLAMQLKVASSLVASRRQLEAISLARPSTRDELQQAGHLMDWQAELLAPVVLNLFNQA
jgi:ribonuclease D